MNVSLDGRVRRIVEDLRSILSRAFESLLGSNGVRVLRFHVERRLSRDMYDVFYEDPVKFYKALSEFFGAGAGDVIDPLCHLGLENKSMFMAKISRFWLLNISIIASGEYPWKSEGYESSTPPIYKTLFKKSQSINTVIINRLKSRSSH